MPRVSRRRRRLIAAASSAPASPAHNGRPQARPSDSPTQPSTDRFALIALGRAGHWEIAILESLERADEWFLELESDNVYLAVRLTRPGVLTELLRFIAAVAADSHPVGGPWQHGDRPAIEFGELGDLPIRLVCDDEEAARCLLIAPSPTGAILRWTLTGNDLEMLAAALAQIVVELPASLNTEFESP
jgi:hypothetical protein